MPSSSPPAEFVVGQQVSVQSRTWAGINKPGGVAKITQLHHQDGYVDRVDVQYVLGGRESKVDVTYIEPYKELGRRSRKPAVVKGPPQAAPAAKKKKNAAAPPKKASAKANKNKAAQAKAEEEHEEKENFEPPSTIAFHPDTPSLSSISPMHVPSPFKVGSIRQALTGKTKKKQSTLSFNKLRTKKLASNKKQTTLSRFLGTPKQPKEETTKTASASAAATKNRESEKSTPIVSNAAAKSATKAASSNKKQPSKKGGATKKRNRLFAKRPAQKKLKPAPPPQCTSAARRSNLMEIATGVKENVSKDSASITVSKATASQRVPLQKVYKEQLSRANAFVGGIVGSSSTKGKASVVVAAASSSSTPKEETTQDEHPIKQAPVEESLQGEEDPARRQLFVRLLNELMMKKMVDEMEMDDMLVQMNDHLRSAHPKSGASAGDTKNPKFTDFEIRSYLRHLEADNKVMVIWETGTIYRI